MSVSEDVYYSYMIPANLALFVGLHLIFRKNVQSAFIYLDRAKKYVADKLRVGFVFVIVGFVAGFFLNLMPTALNYIFYLVRRQ